MHAAQGSAVDWWGLGVLTYELILGRTPFVGEKGKTRFTYLNIMHKEAQFPEARVDTGGQEGAAGGDGKNPGVSEVCKEFIRALLTKDPRGRAGSRGTHAVKAHPFFAQVRWDELRTQEPPLLPSRLGLGNGRGAVPCPPPVTNTSGWTWAAEDALEQAAREGAFPEEVGGENGVFSRFDWANDAADDEVGVAGVTDVRTSLGLGLEQSERNRGGSSRAHDTGLREGGRGASVGALADPSGKRAPVF